jgi:PhzF family phenazine biosynthesis protein
MALSSTTTFSGSLYRLAAFTDQPMGGNPAGVWIGERLPDPQDMQQIAAHVGYSETAFLAPVSEREYLLRYYSPEIEVAFCGHATIASGVLLGKLFGEDAYRLNTSVGQVFISVTNNDGKFTAALTSVDPRYEPASPDLVAAALACFGWSVADLDPAIPPASAYAGTWHLVLALAEHPCLASMKYDFNLLKKIMESENLMTLQLIWREREDLFHARNPFPVGGVVEDPVTGAAAAALGGYLRESGLCAPPFDFTVLQGSEMGRPGRLGVHVPESGGIVVSGNAVFLPSN